MVDKDECVQERPIEERFDKTKKPPIKVKWVDRNKGDRHHMNVRLRLGGETIQHRQGTRVVRSNFTTRDVADATVSNGHWGQAQGVDAQRHKPSVHVRTND